MTRKQPSIPLRIVLAVAVVGLVIGGSILSVRIWGGKSEEIELPEELVIEPGMSIGQLGQVNDIPNPVLKASFGLKGKEDLQNPFSSLGISEEEAVTRIKRNWALAQEASSKDWTKILIKFGLWIGMLTVVFFLIRSAKITPSVRKWLYSAGVLIFGIVLGSDPSPMGTVKDAVVLLGSAGAIFWPRMTALGVFLLMVIVANKFICSWGCQIGTLQDLLFRFNRNRKDTSHLFARQWKPPFWLTNTVRILFFIALTGAAFIWATDIVEPIDPFRIFKPLTLGITGISFISLIVVASIFIYRPWCHFFCPFGLVGWIFEKLSIYRIRVNYDTCIACEACAKACPSTVMGVILKRDKATIPDCFACATCIDVCPTDSITFSRGKREKPPEGKF